MIMMIMIISIFQKWWWYDMIWYDMIWYDMIWYDMIWYWFDWIYIYLNIICSLWCYDDFLECLSILSIVSIYVVLFVFLYFMMIWKVSLYYDESYSVSINRIGMIYDKMSLCFR
jgi:hypothetical protein